jgi:hypothetical protein
MLKRCLFKLFPRSMASKDDREPKKLEYTLETVEKLGKLSDGTSYA